MLRITAVSANAVNYLVEGSGCEPHERALEAGHEHGVERDAADYFLEAVAHGEAPGRWMGKGVGMLGATAGTVIDKDAVRKAFGELKHPETGEQLGRKLSQFKSFDERLQAALAAEPDVTPDRRREIEIDVRGNGRKNVAYYDFTFSPVKSFSMQYAALVEAGRIGEAQMMLDIQRDAVKIAMEVVEEHAGYTRTGYHGSTQNGRSVGVYEQVKGLAAVEFGHSTNREGEPQIHTHVGVLNRAETVGDGKIRALDGKSFRPIKEAAASAYERAVEDLSRQRLGYEWVTRPDGIAREIAGADLNLAMQASTRRAQIEQRSAELIEQYREQHGREPSPATRKAISQTATMETRKAKQEVQGPAAVKAWAENNRDALIRQLDQVERVAAEIRREGHPDQRWMPDQADREAILKTAVENVQVQYATWTVGNLTAEIDKLIVTLPEGVTPAERPKMLEAMTREALRPGNPFGVLTLTAPDPFEVPKALRREADDWSKYRPHIDEIYATADQLSSERRIVAGAAQLTAPKIEGAELELLRIEVEAIQIGGRPIGADQVQAILGIATSGRAGDILIGPAGAGKSTVVGALSKIWTEQHGGRVMGLATSQRATQVLLEEGLEALNVSRFLNRFEPGPDGTAKDTIRPGDLYVVDEAGMASTADLARISALVEAGGAKLLYTGDDAQLSAVGAGGMLNFLTSENGAFQLDEVHRFRDPKDRSKASSWEGEASLRLRAGDVSVVTEYAERGRLRGGTLEQMQAEAMRAYLADTLAGRESLLIVGTNAEATQLAGQIRKELITLGRVSDEPIMRIRDEAQVSVGDVIQARRNDWRITVDGGGWVTNRLTYRVLGRDDQGHLLVEDTSNGARAHLPEDYVREHATLAYASTVHASQGRTVDTSHSLFGEQAQREDGYVASTRGRFENVLYMVTERAPDSHEEGLSVTPAEQLAAMLDRTGADTAAELQYRAAQQDGQSLAWIGGQWDLVSKEYAHDRYTDRLAALVGAEKVDALIGEAAYPALMRTIRSAELRGHNVEALLQEVVTRRELGTAESMSAVLHHRIGQHLPGRQPEQQVDASNWTTFQPPMEGPIGQWAHSLSVASSDRQAELAQQVAAEMPQWARDRLGEVPADPGPRQEWLQRAGIVAAYRELHNVPADQASIGPAPSPETEWHRAMWQAAHQALGAPETAIDVHAASEAELRGMRARWEREQSWAPPWVAEQLQVANEQAREHRHDAVLWRAELETMEPGTPEHAQTFLEVERAERLAADYAEIAYQLDEVHRSRQGWWSATEQARGDDQLAAEELQRRNLPLQPQEQVHEQGELFRIAGEAEVGPEPVREDAPQHQQLDLMRELHQAERPEITTEPVEPAEGVRWWQQWSDDIQAEARQSAQAAVQVPEPERVSEPQVSPDQGELFPMEPRVEDRVLQHRLSDVVPAPELTIEPAAAEQQAPQAPEVEAEPVQVPEPVPSIEERTTIIDALRAARAAAMEASRRQSAEAVQQAQQESAQRQAQVAADEAAERARRDQIEQARKTAERTTTIEKTAAKVPTPEPTPSREPGPELALERVRAQFPTAPGYGSKRGQQRRQPTQQEQELSRAYHNRQRQQQRSRGPERGGPGYGR